MLVVFTFYEVRPYEEKDLEGVIRVYKDAFAEPPWNEFRKCGECGKGYGKDEITISYTYCGPELYPSRGIFFEYLKEEGLDRGECECGASMSTIYQLGLAIAKKTPDNLVEFWSDEDIKDDLDYAMSQNNTIALVLESNNEVLGFTWGYDLPLEKFPFLEGKVKNASYMDEIAVRPDARNRGIGYLLGGNFLELAKELGSSQIVLRTDERNEASMNLFRSLRFSPIPDPDNPRGNVYDPEFENRIYLKRDFIAEREMYGWK